MTSIPFSPLRCAELHDKLVAYAVETDCELAPHITRNIINLPAAPTAHPDDPSTPIRNYFSADLILFLESINTWDFSAAPFASLVPSALPPNLHRFWDFAKHMPEDQYQNVILLYGDAHSSDTGGLFFDMDTGIVYWQLIPVFRWPKPEDWIPLEVALTRWLKLWAVGKIQKYDHGERELLQWCNWELDRDLKAWDTLLQAIEARMPDTCNSSEVKAGMVDRTILGRWPANTFTRKFLAVARAPRKSGLVIAPGIGTFTTSTYHNLYLSEAADSERLLTVRSRNLQEDGLVPSLLFPSPTVVDTNADIFGNFLLQGRAGLYIVPDMDWGDTVTVVNGKGSPGAFRHESRRCPWGPGRDAVLAEVLRRWT